MPTAAILNQERERWARNQSTALTASTAAVSGAVAKKTQIPIAASSASFSGSILKKTLATLSAVGAAFNGSIIKKTLAVLSAVGTAFSGSLIKKTLAILSAAGAAFNGAVSKKTLAALSAVGTAFSGSITKKTFAILSAISAAFKGSLARKTLLVLSAISTALSGVLTRAHVRVMALAASMTALSGGIIKKTSVSISALSSALSGAQAKRISRNLVAISSAFSGNVNKFTKKFYNAVLSAWNAVVNSIKIHPTPAVFQPTVMGRSQVSFGASEIDEFSPSIQMFSGSVPAQPTADGWGNLGQRAMGSQLLVAPGNGSLSNKVYYVIFGGDITIPSDATNTSLSVTLFQNYFQASGQTVISSSDVLSESSFPVIARTTSTWSVVVRLRGNGRLNGILQADTLVGNKITQTFNSNRNPYGEPKIQLSLGVILQGTSSQTPRMRLLQCEIQQG